MRERPKANLEQLYITTLSLLLAHQIDSAFWQEWKLFGFEGGIQGFVLLNIALIPPFLWGIVCLVRAPHIGARFGVVLAALGIAAFAIHSWFFAQGRAEFWTAVSIAVLVGALVTSVALGWRSVQLIRAGEPA